MVRAPATGQERRVSRAVRFDHYGPVEVLDVVDVPRPTPDRGRVLVEVVASAINPGEISIREGAMRERSPASFPSGQGSDLAGRVAEVGDEVAGFEVGDEVIGWTDERAAQAEYVSVPAGQLTARPPGVPWEQAASLYVAGCTAYAMVDAVAPRSGETVAVAGAAGGVGSIAVQLLRTRGARVLGIAGPSRATTTGLRRSARSRSTTATTSRSGCRTRLPRGSRRCSTRTAAGTSSRRSISAPRRTGSSPSPTSRRPSGLA